MGIFIVILLAGLVYAIRKGVLKWESSTIRDAQAGVVAAQLVASLLAVDVPVRAGLLLPSR